MEIVFTGLGLIDRVPRMFPAPANSPREAKKLTNTSDLSPQAEHGYHQTGKTESK